MSIGVWVNIYICTYLGINIYLSRVEEGWRRKVLNKIDVKVEFLLSDGGIVNGSLFYLVSCCLLYVEKEEDLKEIFSKVYREVRGWLLVFIYYIYKCIVFDF